MSFTRNWYKTGRDGQSPPFDPAPRPQSQPPVTVFHPLGHERNNFVQDFVDTHFSHGHRRPIEEPWSVEHWGSGQVEGECYYEKFKMLGDGGDTFDRIGPGSELAYNAEVFVACGRIWDPSQLVHSWPKTMDGPVATVPTKDKNWISLSVDLRHDGVQLKAKWKYQRFCRNLTLKSHARQDTWSFASIWEVEFYKMDVSAKLKVAKATHDNDFDTYVQPNEVLARVAQFPRGRRLTVIFAIDFSAIPGKPSQFDLQSRPAHHQQIGVVGKRPPGRGIAHDMVQVVKSIFKALGWTPTEVTHGEWNATWNGASNTLVVTSAERRVPAHCSHDLMSVVYLLPAPRVGQEKKVWSVNLEPTKTAEDHATVRRYRFEYDRSASEQSSSNASVWRVQGDGGILAFISFL